LILQHKLLECLTLSH